MSRLVVLSPEERLAEIRNIAWRTFETHLDLEAGLRSIYHLIHDNDPAEVDREALTRAAPDLMRELFSIRMSLRDRIGEWQEKGILLRPAEVALRDVFRIARYANDMLGEIASGNARLVPAQQTRRAFTGTAWNTLVHPFYDSGENIPFRSGDVIVVRGSAHNSAAIARIGDVDTQFSHTAIIYVDPKGEHWVVEALIEDGAVINPLERVLDHGLGRAVLYRFKDAGLAARAAEIAYARVLATKTGEARHIPYDFTMRLKGRRALFCAKLIAQSFADASGGKVVLPAFKTRFDPRNRKFYRSIGVRAAETFAPGDMDLDPRFDLVAEWQDYRQTPYLRRQDMIMTKFFEWMETRGWAFREDIFITLISVFGRLSSYLSDNAKSLLESVVPKVPRNMSRSCVATIVMLHKSAEEVMPALAALDEDHVRMTGLPLHPREMLAHLERLRGIAGGRIGYLYGKS